MPLLDPILEISSSKSQFSSYRSLTFLYSLTPKPLCLVHSLLSSNFLHCIPSISRFSLYFALFCDSYELYGSRLLLISEVLFFDSVISFSFSLFLTYLSCQRVMRTLRTGHRTSKKFAERARRRTPLFPVDSCI